MATDVLVNVHDLTSGPVFNRPVTVTLVTNNGPVAIGPWIIPGDSVTHLTDKTGFTGFSNILTLGTYQMTIAGNPARIFPFNVPQTNGTYNITTLAGMTNSVPLYYTAQQVDYLLSNLSGGAGPPVKYDFHAGPGLVVVVTTNSPTSVSVTYYLASLLGVALYADDGQGNSVRLAADNGNGGSSLLNAN